MDKVPFFISFFERSGSTFLANLLNDHPNICCRTEVFDVKKNDEVLGRLPHLINREAVRKKLDSIYGEECKASGFKFKYQIQYQFYPDVYEYLQNMDDKIHVLFLYRRNRLKAAISKQNQIYLSKIGKPANLELNNFVQLDKLHLDIERAFKYINQREILDRKYYEELKKFKFKYIVTYEDLYTKTDLILKNIYSFLGVDPNYQPSAKVKKITNDNIKEALANYEELVEKIICTRYQQYLEMSLT